MFKQAVSDMLEGVDMYLELADEASIAAKHYSDYQMAQRMGEKTALSYVGGERSAFGEAVFSLKERNLAEARFNTAYTSLNKALKQFNGVDNKSFFSDLVRNHNRFSDVAERRFNIEVQQLFPSSQTSLLNYSYLIADLTP